MNVACVLGNQHGGNAWGALPVRMVRVLSWAICRG